MAVKISLSTAINWIKLKLQGSAPSSPDSGYVYLYPKPSDKRLYIKDSTGAETDVSGSVNGPASATDNSVVRFDGTGGKTTQDSAVIVDDNGGMTLPANLALTGDISPSQITSDQNDYNPTGLSTAFTLRLSTDASRNITGLSGGADGRIITAVNVGSQSIVLKDESASSSAANRFALSGDITLAGDDGVILQYDSTSSRWRCIGKSPGGAGGSGAATTNEYVTTASAGDLSAEVTIPGLAGSPDIASAAGAGTSEEYDTSTTGITFDNAVTTVDSDTTAKSHLYIKVTGDTNVHRGTKAWAPAGAFDARMKLHLGGTDLTAQAFGLFISDSASADTTAVFIRLLIDVSVLQYKVQAYTYSTGTPTQRGGTWVYRGGTVYLRITRDGSNIVSFYFSDNGLSWQRITTQSHTFTPTRIGYRTDISNASDTLEAYVDWLRTDV